MILTSAMAPRELLLHGLWELPASLQPILLLVPYQIRIPLKPLSHPLVVPLMFVIQLFPGQLGIPINMEFLPEVLWAPTSLGEPVQDIFMPQQAVSKVVEEAFLQQAVTIQVVRDLLMVPEMLPGYNL